MKNAEENEETVVDLPQNVRLALVGVLATLNGLMSCPGALLTEDQAKGLGALDEAVERFLAVHVQVTNREIILLENEMKISAIQSVRQRTGLRLGSCRAIVERSPACPR